MLDLNNLKQYEENNRLEAKQALGGLPESLWETYSAFANARGGVILLGVEELEEGGLGALDILDPQWLIDDFFDILRDPRRVSVNLLKEEDVQVHLVDGKRIITITVPAAPPEQRPVYLNGDLWRESYVRRGEGDMRLCREEIEEMMAGKNFPDT